MNEQGEYHLYQIEFLASPQDVPCIVGEIQGVLRKENHPTNILRSNDNFYCGSDKPLGDLRATLEQIPGVKGIKELDSYTVS